MFACGCCLNCCLFVGLAAAVVFFFVACTSALCFVSLLGDHVVSFACFSCCDMCCCILSLIGVYRACCVGCSCAMPVL